jgi:hypothetical protein
MIMTVMLEKVDNGPRVTFLFENLPAGLKPQDKETGDRINTEKISTLRE